MVTQSNTTITDVKIVAQVKLIPEADQAAALLATLRTVNEAACWVSGVAFEQGVPREYELRKHTYAELKARGLGAQAAQHVIKKTCDAYTTLKANIKAGNLGKPGSKRRTKAESKPIAFRPEAAQQCSQCGHIDRRNRQSQATFACRSCGALMHADDNASHNLGRKGETLWTAGRESRVPATPYPGVRTEEPTQQPDGHYLQTRSSRTGSS